MNAQAIDNARAGVLDDVTSPGFGSGALTGLGAVTSFAAPFILMAVVLFSFLKDSGQIWGFMLRMLKGGHRAKAELAGNRAMEVLGGALAILQVPLALPLAVLAFVGGFIPLVGATAAGELAVLVALVSNGPVGALIVLAVVVVVNQLEGNFLQPVLMGRAMSVHGLVVLLALTVGTILAGIICAVLCCAVLCCAVLCCAVLSVPLTAVAWTVIKTWSEREVPAVPAAATPALARDPVSV